MSDRELLEMAAKAAGYNTDHPWNALRLTFDPPVTALCIDGVSTGWDPLDDDGHALRLAVKLELFDLDKLLVDLDIHERATSHHLDPLSATRRAIVRAAAELGKAKP